MKPGFISKQKHEYKKTTLTGLDPTEDTSPLKVVVSISSNGCMEKKVCPHCNRGGHYGIPLVFVLHFEDGTISTVCYSCGAKAARKENLKLPRTEAETYGMVEAEDNKKIRKAIIKMEK